MPQHLLAAICTGPDCVCLSHSAYVHVSFSPHSYLLTRLIRRDLACFVCQASMLRIHVHVQLQLARGPFCSCASDELSLHASG